MFVMEGRWVLELLETCERSGALPAALDLGTQESFVFFEGAVERLPDPPEVSVRFDLV